MSSEEIARPLVKYLRLAQERTVDVLSWPAGAGKTRAVLHDVIREVREGGVVLWLTPTVDVLQRATYGRLIGVDKDGEPLPLDDREFAEYLPATQVKRYNAEAAGKVGKTVGDALSGDLNDYFAHPQREGRVFLASWHGYLHAFKSLSPQVKHSAALRVVVDEIPEVRRQATFYLADAAAAAAVRWETYLDMADVNDLRMSSSSEFQAHWTRARGGSTHGTLDAVTSKLPVLAECLTAPELWLSTMLQRGTERTYFVMYLRPEVFNVGRSVEILAANAEDSLLFKIYRQCGIHFRINHKYTKLARLSIENGDRFTIVPLQAGRLSKNQFRQDKDLAQRLVTKAAAAVRAHFGGNEPFIYCLPSAARAPQCPANATQTRTVLSGSNEFKDKHAAAFLAAMNMEDVFAVELQERWGLTREELDAALGVECCYQYAMRLKGRHGRRVLGEKYLVLVGGIDMAEGLQRKIPGSVIDLRHLPPAASGHEAGRRGAGLLGSLPEVLTKAQKNKLLIYCQRIQKAPQMELTRAMRKGLALIATELGKEEGRFRADFLQVARGDAPGHAVFTAAEYRHGMKTGRTL